MNGATGLQSRLARLSLRGRQHAAIAAAALPVLVAVILCVALQWYAGAAADGWRNHEQQAATLAGRSLALVSGVASSGRDALLVPALQAELRQGCRAGAGAAGRIAPVLA
jgi:hypothetical protein